MNKIQQKYQECLNTIPPSGKGMGCHQHLLRTANYGVMIGLDDNKIFSDIMSSVNGQSKGINAIHDSIRTARRDIVPFDTRYQG